MSIGESLPYRSPLVKLIRFFSGSRDSWKAKCKAAKRENKSLKQRLKAKTESRDMWKAYAGRLERQLEAVQAETVAEGSASEGDGERRIHDHSGGRSRLAVGTTPGS